MRTTGSQQRASTNQTTPTMKTPNMNPTRRDFVRTLALFAGVLLLASTSSVWAENESKKTEKPSTSDQDDSARKRYESKVLWEFDALDAVNNKKSRLCGYKGNAYRIFLLPGYKTMIAKIPLDGSPVQTAPLTPDHVTGKDPHRYYSIGVDSAGYIHVSGDMHSSPIVKHWISKNPEDITEFVFAAGENSNKGPQGQSATYPNYFRSPDGVLYHKIRCGDPVMGIGISVLDVKTQTWTMLGDDVSGSGISDKKARQAKGKPLTAWEDNGEGGYFDYMQPHARLDWDKNKRMHLAIGLLNANAPVIKGKHTGSDVLYAYSDDGGKTFHRGNGSKIELPMRAEAGPNQADVVYSRHDGPPPWVGLIPGLKIDDKNRPIVTAQDHKTGRHSFVLENGKWTELEKNTSSSTGNSTATATDEEDEEEPEMNPSNLNLPYKIDALDTEYLRDTGILLYEAEVPVKFKHSRIKIVLAKPVPAQKATVR